MAEDFPPLPSEVIAKILTANGGDEGTVRNQVADIMEALATAGYLIRSGGDLPLTRWNVDKPHRCPLCHAIAVDLERPRWWRVYTCCRCAARFTRWPWLSRVLPDAGIRCSEHQTSERSADA